MRSTRCIALAAGATIGCQFSQPPAIPADARPDAPIDAPVDARAELVTGRWHYQHATPSGVTSPIDLSVFSIRALVPEGAGFRSVVGIGRADGTFEIDDVTPGLSYILMIGRKAYVTDQHSIDLRYPVATRASVRHATMPTPVTLSVNGLDPATSGDRAALISRLAGVSQSFAPALGATDAETTVEWMSEVADFNGAGLGPLPDSTAGDDATMVHYRTETRPDVAIERIIASAPVSLTIRDGEATTVTATLETPGASLVLPRGVSFSLYASGYSQATRPGRMSVLCAAQPTSTTAWGASGAVDLGPPVVTITTEVGAMGLSVTGSYPDPFPPSWPRYCQLVYERKRTFIVPGATNGIDFDAGAVQVVDPSMLHLAPLAPPTGLRVGLVDGDVGGLIRNGSAVSVSWVGVARASQYAVTVYQLRQSGTGTLWRLVTSLSTTETSATIPAELLTGSEYLFFTVTASSGTNDYAHGDLDRYDIPGYAATSVTAMFRLSTTCGDGTVDVGESCDAVVGTASCDVDCTTVVCGDGTRNAAAGEACDTIVDTPGCDADCSPNVCGDGHRNANTEQCDDGNVNAGDGCSPQCRTE